MGSQSDATRTNDRVERLNQIGMALSTERETPALLQRVLRDSRDLTRADAGTVYLIRDGHLHVEVSQNDSLHSYAVAPRGKDALPPIPVDTHTVCGFVAATSQTVKIDDVYIAHEYPFRPPRAYDDCTGYHTRSMLAVPLIDHSDQPMGVLQLLNAKDPRTGEIQAFSLEDEALVRSLASQVGLAIDNVRLVEETRQLHHQNELILFAAGQGIFGLDVAGRFTFANPETGLMLGGDPDELIGRSHHPLCHHSRADGTPLPTEESAIIQTLTRKLLHRCEDDVFWRLDGTSFPVEYVATPMWDEEEVVGAVVVFTDTTERHRAEEERRLMERQLLHSERLASVGIVTAGIVHNLRNSLTGVLSYAQLLAMEHPEISEVRQILESAQQMNQMTDDILVRSRQAKAPEPVDLNRLIQRELDFLQADPVFKHKVEKDVRLSADVPLVECVYTDFSQAVGSLLRNALDAMYDRPRKKLTVISARREDHIEITITDTGKGIEESDMPHLFEPFFTTKTQDADGKGPTGTGLGLYMVHLLLEPYGVQVDVRSTVGEGATFCLRVPVPG